MEGMGSFIDSPFSEERTGERVVTLLFGFGEACPACRK
jgi:hypothetical protein